MQNSTKAHRLQGGRGTKLVLVTLALLLGACGPGFRTLNQSQEELFLGPKFTDGNLITTLSGNIDRSFQWEGTTTSANYYQVLNRLSEIERNNPSSKLQQVLKTAVDAEITSARTGETELTSGNYFRLLVSKQGPAAAEKLRAMKAELQMGLEKVISKISGWQIQQLTVNQPLSPLVQRVFGDLEDLVAWMKSENMNSSLVSALETYSKLKPTILPKVGAIDTELNLAGLSSKLLDLLSSLNVTLDSAVSQELNSALTLGQKVNQMRSSEDALSALVFVWRMLPASDRYATFSSSNKDLADLFKDSGSSDLDCFAGIKSCGLINWGKKKFFVLPGIEDKGVATIQKDLNLQGVTRIRAKIIDLINSKTKDLTQTAPTMIREKFAASTLILDLMISDFSGNMASRLQKQQLRESSLAVREFRVIPSQNSFQLTQGLALPSSFATQAAVAGFLPTVLRYSSLSMAIKESLFLGSISQAAAEQLDPQGPSSALSLTSDANLQVKSLADAIESNSRLLLAIRKDAAVDTLERIFGLSAQNLFTETQSSFLQDMKIFPKGALAAIVLGRVAKLLEALKKENSPVFLVSTNGQVIWADKYQGTAANPETGAVTAGGIVSRNQGARQGTVLSSDVARMLSALSKFTEAIDGIDSLVADYADSTVLKAGRANARMLAVAFSNYLSNQLRREDGLILHELDYQQKKDVSSDVELEDQALAIRALMEARRSLGVTIYQWEAVDTYYAINSKMFNTTTGFYKSRLTGSSNRDHLPEFVNNLTAIMSVRPVLPAANQRQFNMIFNPWVASLEQISLTEP